MKIVSTAALLASVLLHGILTTPIVGATPTGPLLYSTFLGGGRSDDSYQLFVDASGNTYVVGSTMSTDFPATPGALSTNFKGGSTDTDAFVAKLKPQGNGLVFATFLGGSSSDYAYSIAVDGAGNIYVAGTTTSSDFPTTVGSFQATAPGGYTNAFVAKLSPDGSALLYSTFLGGSDSDNAQAIAVDASGNAYVVGDTRSSDFPTTPGALDTSLEGTQDAFVVKLNPAGSALVYGTLLGGIWLDFGLTISLDASGTAYVGGVTHGMATTLGAFDTAYGGGGDAYVARLSPAGDNLLYGTFLGGTDWDEVSSIRLDSSGNVYVTGYTRSADFPTTAGAFDTTPNGSQDTILVKINPDGSGLVYSTLLGGSDLDRGFALTVDSSGNVYVTGTTGSSNFPTTTTALDTTFNSGDAFVAQLDPLGRTLTYSTFLGGGGTESGRSIALGQSGEIFVAGYTSSANFPTTTASFDTTYGGTQYDSDAFVTELVLTSENAGGSTGWLLVFWWVLPILGGGIAAAAGIILYRKRRASTGPASTPL